MNKVRDFIKDNFRQIIDIFTLISAAVVPYIFNISSWFESYLTDAIITPETFIQYFIISRGNIFISLAFITIVLLLVRKINNDYIMNNKNNIYHNYPYMWYYFCSKILGIRKCSLVLVPIYQQFKLVVNSVFEGFPLNEMDYPIIENQKECPIQVFNTREHYKEVNLILEDTYMIELTQLPDYKEGLFTIKISRCEVCNGERHFSDIFIETVINVVRKLSDGIRVNIFATTNPMNTEHIARRAFSLANRSNVNHLFVYQQEMHTTEKKFDIKEHKIY